MLPCNRERLEYKKMRESFQLFETKSAFEIEEPTCYDTFWCVLTRSGVFLLVLEYSEVLKNPIQMSTENTSRYKMLCRVNYAFVT